MLATRNRRVTLALITAALSVTYCTIIQIDSDNTKNMLKAYDEYYRTTEALLDTLYIENPNLFDDVISEMDVNVEYISTKTVLDSILNEVYP